MTAEKLRRAVLATPSLPLLLCVLALLHHVGAQSYNHTTADLSQARLRLSATAAGTSILFAGGSVPTKKPVSSSSVDVYDSSTDAWSTASLSSARSMLCATSVGNLAFFAGGAGPNGVSSVVDIYDANKGTWSTASLSIARYQLACASALDVVVFAGGLAYSAASDAVDVYNATTGAWTQTKLSVARGMLSAAAVGELIIFAGGNTASGASSAVDIYDVRLGTWKETNASLTVGRYFMGAASVADVAMFAGGNLVIGWPSDRVDVYNATSGAWSTASLSSARIHVTGGSAGDLAFFAGGTTTVGSYTTLPSPSDAVDVYRADTHEWERTTLSHARYVSAGATLGGSFMVAGGEGGQGALNGKNEIFYTTVDIYDVQGVELPDARLGATFALPTVSPSPSPS